MMGTAVDKTQAAGLRWGIPLLLTSVSLYATLQLLYREAGFAPVVILIAGYAVPVAWAFVLLFRRGTERPLILFSMVNKIALIPWYVFVIVIAASKPSWFLKPAIVVDAAFLFATSLPITFGIAKSCARGTLPKRHAVLFGILSWLYGIDIIASVVLWVVACRTPKPRTQ